MSPESLGFCPICLGRLKREGDKLLCENGDYIVLEIDFDLLWRDYETKGDAEVLLQSLLEKNMKE